MKATYEECRPSPFLEAIVDTYWHRTFDDLQAAFSALKSCLPHGMVEVIVHLDEKRSEVFFNGGWTPLPKACLAGIRKDPMIWRAPVNTGLFGIRFKPENISWLFGVSSKGIANKLIDAAQLSNKIIPAIITAIQDLPDNPSRIFCIETILRVSSPKNRPINADLIRALDLIRDSILIFSVDELSQIISLSERQLQRLFKANLGVGPKSYIQIIRFRKICQLLQARPDISCHDIAYCFGYADQAHFIRDFKTFSGKTPKGLLVN